MGNAMSSVNRVRQMIADGLLKKQLSQADVLRDVNERWELMAGDILGAAPELQPGEHYYRVDEFLPASCGMVVHCVVARNRYEAKEIAQRNWNGGELVGVCEIAVAFGLLGHRTRE